MHRNENATREVGINFAPKLSLKEISFMICFTARSLFIGLIALTFLSCQCSWGRQIQGEEERFAIVAYNVENLFDADDVALYDDYKSDRYQAKDLLIKLKNIARILANFKQGKGPEIILFQEFEADQTPGTSPFDYAAFLKTYSGTTVEMMLGEGLTDEVRDLPVEALLLKILQDTGLNPYQVAVGEYRPDPTGRTVAHVNATFSQYPISHSSTHQTDGARGILEVVHDINGVPLVTMNNHWKSGASNVDDEKIRLGNARTLRDRLDQILLADPAADVVIGGDFNSQYNQNMTNPQMEQTAINTVAGSQGDEIAIRNTNGPSLYNLWYELPQNRRGSDVYSEQWGTLMQLMITRGLYDFNGIQYIDNSFNVAILENVNCQVGSRAPIRWQSIDGHSGGFSDHLPIYAQFRTVKDQDKDRYVSAHNPGVNDASSQLRRIDYAATAQVKALRSISSLGSDAAIKSIDNIGHAFWVEATVSGEFPFRIKIFEEEFTVWAYNEKFRVSIYNRYPVGQPMNFLGELGIHKGKWQFIVRDPSWLEFTQP